MQSPVLTAVCPSVCPSATRWHWVKTTQGGITKDDIIQKHIDKIIIVDDGG